MKTSGLDKNILIKIFLIVSQSYTSQLNKEELYIILRLIALAQNNMPFSAENIERNSPIPPLPKFNYSINNNVMSINNSQINFNNKNENDNAIDNKSIDDKNINNSIEQNSLFIISEREKKKL